MAALGEEGDERALEIALVLGRSEAGGRTREQHLSVGQHQQLPGVALGFGDVMGREGDARSGAHAVVDELPERARWRGSSEEAGSSSSSTAGSEIKPIAMFTRWRLPPERRPTSSPARALSPVCSSIRSTAASVSAMPSSRAKRRRFSATESFE
jgi:hypothetical protein